MPTAADLAGGVAPSSWTQRVRLASVVAVVELAVVLLVQGWQPDRRSLDVLGAVLLLLGTAFLLGRELPVARLVGAAAAWAAYVAAGYPVGAEWLAPLLVLAGAVLVTRLREPAAAGLTGVVVAVAASGLGPHPMGVERALVAFAAVVAVLGAADALRMRVRAQRAREKYTEHSRLRRLADERVRITRGVHEHLAVDVSRMSRRARLARHLIDTYDHRAPAEARAALEEISSAGLDAVEELRVVGTLLDGGGATALRTPPPGLSSLSQLVLLHGAAGLTVTVSGDAGRPPRAVDLAAYDIVAVALDNVAHHSVALAAEVTFGSEEVLGERLLVVGVHDAGPPREAGAAAGVPADATHPRRPAGSLADLRARVELLGGSLSAGPDAAGGWRVRAVLPLL